MEVNSGCVPTLALYMVSIYEKVGQSREEVQGHDTQENNSCVAGWGSSKWRQFYKVFTTAFAAVPEGQVIVIRLNADKMKPHGNRIFSHAIVVIAR